MSYDRDHELDDDYAGEAAYERYCREHQLEWYESLEDDDILTDDVDGSPGYPKDERIEVESDGDDGDGVDDGDEMIASKRAVEQHLQQTADAVDRILGEGRR